jgi:hypothetical protein
VSQGSTPFKAHRQFSLIISAFDEAIPTTNHPIMSAVYKRQEDDSQHALDVFL